MKKGVFIYLVLFLILINLTFVLAEDNVTVQNDSEEDELSQIDLAYECLSDKVEDRDCDDLSMEEVTFVALASGECSDELIEEAKGSSKCWPETGCTIKSTAQAILALDRLGKDTSNAEEWLFDQNITSPNMDWFLQIESSNQTTCEIDYDGSSYTIDLGEDKKINRNAGTCLSLSTGSYWFKISSSCYDEEFEISCDEPFLTTLLFRKEGSSTYHVSEKATSASAEGTTTERIRSSCFTTGSSCDYESNLWATLAIYNLGYDINSYLPYLMAMADENSRYLPESFLYLLTGYSDFRNELLLKQINNYWDESGDKIYDTAVALYPFQYESPAEKSASQEWLLEIQDNDGCWQGNIRNTAFILHSLWPKTVSGGSGDITIDCEAAGYYCMSSVNCLGTVLNGYSCSGVSKCCDTPVVLETCEEQAGEICNSAQTCVAGIITDASDTQTGETCCIGGSCQVASEKSECEQNGGSCEIYGCSTEEEEATYSCDSGAVCCIQKTTITNSKSYWWVWLLLVLIILVVLGIIFRDKIKPYWFKIKSKFSKNKTSKNNNTLSRNIRPLRRTSSPRRIFHPSQRKTLPTRTPKAQSNKELDDVLKRLKEMGE